MSTVAMTRMTSDVQDDSTANATTTTTTMEHEEDPENNTTGTRKSDSGVYFAMMLSEYLDKNANELPSDQLKPIQEITSHNKVGQDLKNSNTAAFPSSSSISATTTSTTTPATNMTIMNTQPRLSTTTNENKEEENDNSPEVKAANEAMANLSNLIWVPAHKHPQIAPSEFVNWIQVHGAAPTRKGSKVKRQKSQLSRSMSYNDPPADFDKDTESTTTTSDSDSPVSPQDTDSRQLPGISENVAVNQKNGYVFDRHSTVVDDSRILAPPTQNRSLLRRSAFSARRAPGEDNGTRRKSRRPPPTPRHSTDTSDRMGHIPSAEPISLHDHPVSMSEWIDLGSASLEPADSQHGILSRVHDAESQLFSKIMDKDRQNQNADNDDKNNEKIQVDPSMNVTSFTIKEEDEEKGQPRILEESSDTSLLTTTTTTTTAAAAAVDDPETTSDNTITTYTDKRKVSLRRSASDLVNEKSDRKSSWISGFLNNGKKKSRRGSLRRVDDVRHLNEKEKETLQLTRVNSVSNNNNDDNSKKRGFAAFISRSLSLKSIARKESKWNRPRAKPMVTTTQQQEQLQNGINGQPNNNIVTRQYINSYRLPIHVERAVYRLSHMKLANPRRPLHQQVVISNFMFWYLSIINPQPSQDMQQQNMNGNGSSWPQQPQQQQQQSEPQQQQQQQQYYQQQTETNEAALMNRTRPPKISANRRFSDDSISVSRRTSQSSSDEEDNVPLSHFRQ